MMRLGGLALAAVFVLSGCAVQISAGDEPPTAPASSNGSGLKPEIEAAAISQWTQNWCAARDAATGTEAVDLMGPPTETADRGTETLLEWKAGPHAMSITVDTDDTLTGTSRVSTGLSDADEQALDCE